MFHPMESIVEKALAELQVDVQDAKKVFEITNSGHCYDFKLGPTDVSISLPLFVPSRNSNLSRFEWIIGMIPKEYEAQALMCVSNYLDTHAHSTPVKPVLRYCSCHSGAWLHLIFVCEHDFIQPEAISRLIGSGAELASFFMTFIPSELELDETDLQQVG